MTISKAYCPDASILVRFLVSGEPGSAIANLWESWLDAGYSLIAPTLIFYEVANVLHQHVRQKILTRQEADTAFQLALNLNLVTMMDADLHKRAILMARTHQLPATYDAHYLALSERMGAEFWTLDGKLVSKVQSELPWVRLWSG